MKYNIIRYKIIMFIVMFFVGIFFNPMNILMYKINHFYISTTLIYSGLLMASNMMWAHEIVHYISIGHFNFYIFLFGLFLSFFISILLLREQFMVSEREWLKRMISHHSTAITTSKQLIKKNKKSKIFRFIKNLIYNQEQEIEYMKSLL